MTSRGADVSAVLSALILALAACAEPQPEAAQRDAELARLTAAVEELTEAQRDLGEAVQRQGRQLSALGRRLADVGRGPSGASAAGEGGDASETSGLAAAGAAAVDGDPQPAAGAVEEILATDAGRRAIQQAAAAEVARRETQERRTFVSFVIGRFARDAGLDDRQADELQTIWKDSLDAGVELRRDFAALREVPEAERPAAREKVMETMRAIGRSRNERIGRLLTQTQLEQYQPVENEIVEAMHGGPRRPAGGRSGQ